MNTAIKWSTRIKKDDHEKFPDEYQILIKGVEIDPKLEWLYNEISILDAIDQSLTLLLLDGFSYSEMSDIIGISPSNVGVKINRIKNRLKKRAQLIENEY